MNNRNTDSDSQSVFSDQDIPDYTNEFYNDSILSLVSSIIADGEHAVYNDGEYAVFNNGEYAAYNDGEHTAYNDGEYAVFNDNNPTSYLLVEPLSVVHINQTLWSNDITLYQNNAIGYSEQQFLNENSNAFVGPSTQHVENNFIHSQNNTSNYLFNMSPFINSENMTQMPLELLSSPSRRSITSNSSYHTASNSFQTGGGMNNLSPDEYNNNSILSPYVGSSASSPYNSSTPIASFQQFYQDYTDQDLYNLSMAYKNSMNNDCGLHPSFLDYANYNDFLYGNIYQYGSSSLRMNNGTHATDNAPSSSKHQNNTNLNNLGICFIRNGEPSSSTMGNLPSNFIPNDNNDEMYDDISSETSSNNTIKSKDKGKGKARCDKENHECYLCGLKLNRKQDLKRHLKIHSGLKEYICKRCHRAFARKDALLRHLNSPMGCKKYKKN